MTKPSSIRSSIRSSEQGYIMLFAIFLMALLTISLALAMPDVIKSIQRDRDLETFHRGMQYRRAVQLYYRQFHAYPPNLDALVATNNVRFLRKKYIDPISGKVDWKPILFGQNKTPTAMGFFGQPLAGGATTIAGTGPSGGNLSAPGSSGGGILPGGISDIFGGGSSSATSTPSSTGATGAGGASSTGATASGTSGSGASGSDQSGQSSQSFGGAGIIGFEPVSAKPSILIYKKKQHYNEWEFTYDPISDMQTMGGGNTGVAGQPAGSTTSPAGSSAFGSSSFGSSSFGSSTFGSPSSNTMSPSPASPTTTPQQ